MTDKNTASGSCYCGIIKFNMCDFNPNYGTCHCTECLKWTGSFYAAITIARDHYKIDGFEHITWHDQTAQAERGFCSVCGSTIFWRPKNQKIGQMDFAVGMLNDVSKLTQSKHIFCASKPDYYALPNDDAARFDERG